VATRRCVTLFSIVESDEELSLGVELVVYGAPPLAFGTRKC
jgi:hypothetical protein